LWQSFNVWWFIHLSRFFSCIAQHRPYLVDINLCDNSLGDSNVPYVIKLMMELKGILEQLHLNNNSLTEGCAAELGAALAQMQTIKVLRLSNNPFGTRGIESVIKVGR
jgi:Ran GTPase-activating protein (RanGAP) involved in mRNA processing and transport